MTTDLTPAAASPFDAIKRTDEQGEHWSAREAMTLMEYERWERFADVIERAKVACANSGQPAEHHFRGAAKVIKGGRWGQQTVADYRLTRYGAYLTAMNGDPRKPAIARAQTYFAIKTREAEVKGTHQTRTPALPQTYAEALRELAASVEAKEQAQAALEAAKPMVDAWQTFLNSAGDMSVADTAKALARAGIRVGPRDLYRELHVWGWTFRAESRHTGKVGPWKAKQTQVDCGRLAMKPTQYEDHVTGELRDGDPQVRITPKGAEEIRRRLDRGELATTP